MSVRTFEFSQLAFMGFLDLTSTQFESLIFCFPLLFQIAFGVLLLSSIKIIMFVEEYHILSLPSNISIFDFNTKFH
jgi:hypothetical protein